MYRIARSQHSTTKLPYAAAQYQERQERLTHPSSRISDGRTLRSGTPGDGTALPGGWNPVEYGLLELKDCICCCPPDPYPCCRLIWGEPLPEASSVNTGIEDMPSEYVGMVETMGFDEATAGNGLVAGATLVTGILGGGLDNAETFAGIDDVAGVSLNNFGVN